MTDAAILEAVRAVSGSSGALDPNAVGAVQAVADPAAVDAFQKAMGTGAVADVPFASQVTATWKAAQVDHQGLLNRIKSLSEMTRLSGADAGSMVELQYQVANLSFQQEVVTSIAKKASDAVSTLIKNGS